MIPGYPVERPQRAFGRIAIVDDNPDDVFFLQHQLRRIGVNCPICTFSDGLEAMTFFRQAAAVEDRSLIPQILFLDINMPGATGFSVLCWVREQEFLKSLKVAILSGSGDPGDVALASELSADAFVAKHPSPSKLATILARLAPGLMPPDRSAPQTAEPSRAPVTAADAHPVHAHRHRARAA
jgi:CheY-like chemotaxis protein